MGVCGLICVSLGVLDVKKFENHCYLSADTCCYYHRFLKQGPVWFSKSYRIINGRCWKLKFPPKTLREDFRGSVQGEPQLFLRSPIFPRETASRSLVREKWPPGSSWKVSWSFSPGGHTWDPSHKANGGGHVGKWWHSPHVEYSPPCGPPGEKQFWT